MTWRRTFRPLMAVGLAIALPLAVYLPLKAQNPHFYQFFDQARCLSYFHAVVAWLFMAASVLAAGGLMGRAASRRGVLPPLKDSDWGLKICLFTGLGLGAHMAGLFVLAATGLLSLKFIVPANLIILMAGAGELKRLWSDTFASKPKQPLCPPRLPRWGAVLFGCCAVAAMLPVWLMLGTPVGEWDELVYQLTIPRQMLAAGGFVRQPFMFFFDWPLNMNLIYAEAMAMGTHVTARFWHGALGLLTAALAGRMAARWTGITAAGWLAAAIFLTIPVVQLELGVAMVDLALAFYVMLAVEIWDHGASDQDDVSRESPRLSPWIRGIGPGLFLGLAAGVKYMGLYALVAVAGAMLAELVWAGGRRKWGWKPTAAMGLTALVVFTPWAVKNWVFTGNPLYPQFYSLFGGADWSAEFARQWREWIFRLGPGRGFDDFVLLPWRLTFQSSPMYADFAGELSPYVFPTVAMALLQPGLWTKIRRPLLVALIYIVLWFLSSQQMRFLIPVFALLAAVGGAGLARTLVHPVRGEVRTAALAAFVFATAWVLYPTPMSIANLNFTVTFGQPHAVDSDGYLRHYRGVDHIHAVRELNSLMGGEGKALLMFENRGYYLEQPYIADGAFEVSRIVDQFMSASDGGEFADWLRDQGVTHILWNQNYSESESGKIVSQYYPEYGNKWKKFIADHAKIVYQERNIFILQVIAGSPETAGDQAALRLGQE